MFQIADHRNLLHVTSQSDSTPKRWPSKRWGAVESRAQTTTKTSDRVVNQGMDVIQNVVDGGACRSSWGPLFMHSLGRSSDPRRPHALALWRQFSGSRVPLSSRAMWDVHLPLPLDHPRNLMSSFLVPHSSAPRSLLSIFCFSGVRCFLAFCCHVGYHGLLGLMGGSEPLCAVSAVGFRAHGLFRSDFCSVAWIPRVWERVKCEED